jgi:hypothetical protein
MSSHSKVPRYAFGLIAGALLSATMLTTVAQAQDRRDERREERAIQAEAEKAKGKQPNILFIMGDDIGWMQPGIYHRGLMVGETPNIDRIGQEGAVFMDYVAMQSCTSGRNAFFTGMYPLRTGMIPP